MLYVKDGYPEENENVLCIVTKIYGNTTFVDIPEYNKEGVLTISEIAPGRIRNLRDYVVENKKIVCKVLRVDKKQKRIDVSLKRVNHNASKAKLEEIKKEENANKIFEEIARRLNTTKDKIFEKVYEEIFENYDLVYDALYDIMLDNEKINIFKNLTDKEKEVILEVINSKIKPKIVILKKRFELYSEIEPIDKIKNILRKSLDSTNNKENFEIKYLASGEYRVILKHNDIREAEKSMDNFFKNLEKNIDKNITFNLLENK